MAVFVGQGALAEAASGNVTAALGTGASAPRPGDLVVVPVISADAVAHSLPAGWQNNNFAIAAKMQLSVNLRIYDGQWTGPLVTHAAGSAIIARTIAIRGPFPPDILSRVVVGTAQGNTGTTTATAPSVTPLEGYAMLMALFFDELTANTSGAPTWASYSGTLPTLTEISDTRATGLGADMVSFGFAWGQVGTSPVTGNRTAVVSGEGATPTNVAGVMLSVPEALWVPAARGTDAPGSVTIWQVPEGPRVPPAAAAPTAVEMQAVASATFDDGVVVAEVSGTAVATYTDSAPGTATVTAQVVATTTYSGAGSASWATAGTVGTGTFSAPGVAYISSSAVANGQWSAPGTATRTCTSVGTATYSAPGTAYTSATSVSTGTWQGLGDFQLGAFVMQAVASGTWSAPGSSSVSTSAVGTSTFSANPSAVHTCTQVATYTTSAAGSCVRSSTSVGQVSYSSATPVCVVSATSVSSGTWGALGDFVIPSAPMQAVASATFSSPASATRTCTQVATYTLSSPGTVVYGAAQAVGTATFAAPGTATRTVTKVANYLLNGNGSAYYSLNAVATALFSSPALLITGDKAFLGQIPTLESVSRVEVLPAITKTGPSTEEVTKTEIPATISPVRPALESVEKVQP